MLTIRPLKTGDLEILAKTLRRADVQEIEAATGSTPAVALQTGIRHSEFTRIAADKEDRPVAIFGVSPGHMVWMVATDSLLKHRKDFLRQSRIVVDWLLAKYGWLGNIVDSRNGTHIRWLDWCGFHVDYKEHIYLHDPDVVFHPFTRST